MWTFEGENNPHVVCSYREVGVVCCSAISTLPAGNDLLLVHSNTKHATPDSFGWRMMNASPVGFQYDLKCSFHPFLSLMIQNNQFMYMKVNSNILKKQVQVLLTYRDSVTWTERLTRKNKATMGGLSSHQGSSLPVSTASSLTLKPLTLY